MKSANLELSFHDRVALLRLAKAGDASNSLGRAFLEELGSAVKSVRDREDLSILIFTGTGRTFSTGADLREINHHETPKILDFLRSGQTLMTQILDLDLITIAGLNGLALGGGLEMALACDLRWAHSRTVVGFPESRLGLVPGWGGIPLLRRAVRDASLVEMIVGGDYLSAGKALEAGLINRLFEGADFQARLLDAAAKAFRHGAGETREIKALINRDRTPLDLAATDETFLRLWHKRNRSVKPCGR